MTNPNRGTLLERIEKAACARLIGAVDGFLASLWGSFDTAELSDLAAGLGTLPALRTPAQAAACDGFDAALGAWLAAGCNPRRMARTRRADDA